MTAGIKWRLAQYLELQWWRRYLQPKDPAAYLAWKKNYWTKLLQALQPPLNLPKHAHILDAGCGPAGIFTALPHHRVVALDPLLGAYQARLAPFFLPKQYPNVQFREQALESLTDLAAYDAVFCLNVINHVADIRRAVCQLVAALRPHGYLVLSIDAHNYPLFKHLFRLIPLDALHPHQYDLSDYQQMLPSNLQHQKTLRYDTGFFFDYYVLIYQKVG